MSRALIDDEYVDVDNEDYSPNPQLEIQALKQELAAYDYIGVKIAMGVATTKDYADKISYTEELRKQIRKLEENNGQSDSK